MNLYRNAHRVAPYLAYSIRLFLNVPAGAVAVPLANGNPGNANPRKTCKLVQTHEPQTIIAYEWSGVRLNAKVEPPLVTTLGSFVLSHAAAQVDHVRKDAGGGDIVSASGYILLLSDERPEDAVVPSLWCPYDGRYGDPSVTVAQYQYTPADLGFGVLLPGASIKQLRQPGNPVPGQQSGQSIKF